MEKQTKNILKLILVVISILIFIIIIKNIFEKDIYVFDDLVYSKISNFISDNSTSILKVITNLGGTFVIVTVCVILIIIFKSKGCSKYIVINLCIATLLNQGMKFIFKRPRPNENIIIEQGGYSFPSGHSMVSMAFYGFLIYLINKHIENKILRRFLYVIISLIIVSIGFSRIYLGAHYASDVIGGFCFSIAYLIIFIKIIEIKGKSKDNNRIIDEQ